MLKKYDFFRIYEQYIELKEQKRYIYQCINITAYTNTIDAAT